MSTLPVSANRHSNRRKITKAYGVLSWYFEKLSTRGPSGVQLDPNQIFIVNGSKGGTSSTVDRLVDISAAIRKAKLSRKHERHVVAEFCNLQTDKKSPHRQKDHHFTLYQALNKIDRVFEMRNVYNG